MYFEGQALRGWFLRGHFGYESFTAEITEPTTLAHASARVKSPILGGMIGSSHVFGRNGGVAQATQIDAKIQAEAAADAAKNP